MTNSQIIDVRQRLAELNQGVPWYGRNIIELLDAVDENKFISEVKGYPNTIQGLALHILTWRHVLIRKFQGDTQYTVKINTPEDWPKDQNLNKSSFKRKLHDSYKLIIDHLEDKDDEWLLTLVPGEKFNFKYMIEGVIQHDLYHMGQIVILNKILSSSSL